MLIKVTNWIKKNKFFTIIIILGIYLRFMGIDQTPPSLNWDEVSHGYNAYSILKTGKDEWGQTFPLIFRAYGDYKLPVYIYTTVLSILVFGLNTFAVRIPSMIAGILLIVYTYLLTSELQKDLSKKYLKDKSLPLLTALFVAVEPWTIFTSRAAFEANLSQFLIVAGAYYILRSIKNSSRSLILGSILIGLSVWTYNSARIFIPLLLLSFAIIYRKDIYSIKKDSTKRIAWSFVILLFFLIPMIFQLINPTGQARYSWVAIVDEGAVNQIIQKRLSSDLPTEITRAIYNRPIYFSIHFIQNYIEHFSPNYLFFEGGSDYQFNIPAYGLLHPIGIVFFYIGLVLILARSRGTKGSQSYKLILMWTLLSPIASSITRESPHTLRAITMLPMPMLLTSIGVLTTLKVIIIRLGKTTNLLMEYGFKEVSTKKLFYASYLLIIGVMMSVYLFFYKNAYTKEYSWSWQYGYEQVVNIAKERYESYDKIVVTKKYGEPHEFFLFYWPWSPSDYHNDPNRIRFEQSDWFWVDRFDNIFFVNDWQIVEEGTDNNNFILESGNSVDCEFQKCMLITSPNNVPDGWKQLEKIRFLNGEIAFEIYEN